MSRTTRAGPSQADAIYSVFRPAVALVAGLAIWWAVTRAFDVPAFYLPPPESVAARLLGNPELYLTNALFTLEKVLYGGAVGVSAGFVLALVVAFVPAIRRVVMPYVVTARVLPKIAIAPVLLIYMGTGMDTAILFVALISFFPMVLNTAAGFDRAPRGHLELLRSVDASRYRRFRSVYLPYALPDVFAGLKQSVTLAVVGAVVAEWIVTDSGLGYVILIGSENIRTDVMLAALFSLLVLGLLLYGAVAALQRLLLAGTLESAADPS